MNGLSLETPSKMIGDISWLLQVSLPFVRGLFVDKRKVTPMPRRPESRAKDSFQKGCCSEKNSALQGEK